MKSEYNAGDLVGKTKFVEEEDLGVLIARDGVHPKFWKVLSNEGIVSWFESNFEKLDEYTNDSKTTH